MAYPRVAARCALATKLALMLIMPLALAACGYKSDLTLPARAAASFSTAPLA